MISLNWMQTENQQTQKEAFLGALFLTKSRNLSKNMYKSPLQDEFYNYEDRLNRQIDLHKQALLD